MMKCVGLQITGESIGEVITVSTMHQMKAEMGRQADAFVALPGWLFFSCKSYVYAQYPQLWKVNKCVALFDNQKNIGGYGTFEELLEVITWSQLGIHTKPVINNKKIQL